MVSQSVVVCLALLAVASATDVDQCPGRSLDNLSSNVQLSPCKKPPCRLKKGTNQHINITIITDSAIENLTNDVKANVFGVDVPFIGVHGLSICDKLWSESGEKASCPLTAGTTYIYKDQFPVESWYPKLDTTIRWALENDGKELVCFQVKARIV